MTLEDVFADLYAKYGEELPWGLITDSKSAGMFVVELKKELKDKNGLLHYEINAVARSYAADDVLYRLRCDWQNELYRIYHLTYSEQNSEGFPKYIEFTQIQQVKDYIEQEYVKNYT